MGGTNHLLIDLDPASSPSCCYVRLDPRRRRPEPARAGHPPPLLRHPDGQPRSWSCPAEWSSGWIHSPLPGHRAPVEPGAVLALYTDGLVERPGHDIDDGITALRIALSRPAPPPPVRAADRCPRSPIACRDARHSADRPDDIALLLATRRAAHGNQR